LGAKEAACGNGKGQVVSKPCLCKKNIEGIAGFYADALQRIPQRV
jgi:hypothetical protein